MPVTWSDEKLILFTRGHLSIMLPVFLFRELVLPYDCALTSLDWAQCVGGRGECGVVTSSCFFPAYTFLEASWHANQLQLL